MCYLSAVSLLEAADAIQPLEQLAASFSGWVPDRNKRIAQARHFAINLKAFATMKVTYNHISRVDDEAGQQLEKSENAKTFAVLETSRSIHRFLEEALRKVTTIALPTPVKVEVISQFQAAIAKLGEMRATLSYACGENDYRDLGFEVLPKIEEPAVPDDLTDLFRDAS